MRDINAQQQHYHQQQQQASKPHPENNTPTSDTEYIDFEEVK